MTDAAQCSLSSEENQKLSDMFWYQSPCNNGEKKRPQTATSLPPLIQIPNIYYHPKHSKVHHSMSLRLTWLQYGSIKNKKKKK
jgi:hypothetical protein